MKNTLIIEKVQKVAYNVLSYLMVIGVMKMGVILRM